MAGLDAAGIASVYGALESHAKLLGLFAAVTMHEPFNPPGAGLTLAMTEGQIRSAPSGLARQSLTWEWAVRIYLAAEKQAAGEAVPHDQKLTAAAVTVLAAWAGDLDLTAYGAVPGLVRAVDTPSAVTEPKWLDWGGKRFRVRDTTLALVINDAYAQGAG